ncbi:hypothetical protein [Tatumella ptyseos]|uniref:Citrate synthase n=1 Tax=Tatumella ptyseos TaxID=82987 RepID=A0A2X5P6X2_9GAMM|nr:Citrate synthase [Tatumella ptyseos]
MTDKKVTLTLDGAEPLELNVLRGTLGQHVIDVRALGNSGLYTFDPGIPPRHPASPE